MAMEHGVKDIEKFKKTYEEQLEYLIYNFPNIEKFTQKLNDIKAIFYPSVIEILLKGFGNNNPDWNCTLLDGFKDEFLENRHQKLMFQHRMHPAISKFQERLFIVI